MLYQYKTLALNIQPITMDTNGKKYDDHVR
jgi:hypothetical protein